LTTTTRKVRVERAHSRARDTHTPLKNSIFDYLIFWATFRLGFFRFPNPNKRPFRRRDKEKGKKKKKGGKNTNQLFSRDTTSASFDFYPTAKILTLVLFLLCLLLLLLNRPEP
tara:strand:+ start:96 stop:434 length:339 start_codon:yes stop_codon:yes gene_type:complete